jgi:nucleotide-binding universal stress UspA family protein
MTHGTDNGGPVLFAYDGSEQANAAIREAARQLGADRHGIVLTVWEPMAAFPFAGAAVSGTVFEDDFEAEALRVADEGASLARSLGLDATPLAERGDPVWQSIVAAADEHEASIVVMGSHGRTGIALVLLGSVAANVVRHTSRPVLIVHAPPAANGA